jgi:tetratricopeptide (TPR) repeat protein
MYNIAEALRQQGKDTEAEAMFLQTLQLQGKVLGKEHPNTLLSMMSLAALLGQQGKYAEAETIHRQIQLQGRELGKAHLGTLNMMGLAKSLFGQGKYAEAEAIYSTDAIEP